MSGSKTRKSSVQRQQHSDRREIERAETKRLCTDVKRQRKPTYTSAHSEPTSPNVWTNISRAVLRASDDSEYFFCWSSALPRSSCSWGLVVARAAPPPIAEDICCVELRKLQRRECFCQQHVGCWNYRDDKHFCASANNDKLLGGRYAHMICEYIHIYVHDISYHMWGCASLAAAAAAFACGSVNFSGERETSTPSKSNLWFVVGIKKTFLRQNWHSVHFSNKHKLSKFTGTKK